jgi:hypothetical protein
MKDDELKPIEQTQSTITPVPEHSRLGGGPTISGVHRDLSDVELLRVAGGPAVINVIDVSTITDLADEDLRQVAGGPIIYNVD